MEITPLIEAKSEIYNLILISLVLVYAIANPLITWAFKPGNTKWGNYWTVWFFTLLTLSILVTFAIASPELIFEQLNNLKESFLN